MTRRLTALLWLIVATPAWAASQTPPPADARTPPPSAPRKCLVIGHRGNPVAFPENTLRSFASAFDGGADMVEMDVRLTRDGVPVIFHDDVLEMTTSAHGRVADLSWDELKNVKAGSLRDDGMTDPIPTLEQALLLAHGRGRVLLDIKVDGMGAAIASLFEKNHLPQDMAAVGTWTDAQAAEYLRYLPRAQILNTQDVPIEWRATLDAQRQLGIDVFELWDQNIPAGFVEAVHAHGFLVFVYTVNQEADMRRLIALGVDGIETDVPELLRHIIREHGDGK